MVSVFISNRAASARVEMYPNRGDGLETLVQEFGEYLIDIEGISNPDLAELYFNDEKLIALRSPAPGVGRWIWSVAFYAGEAEFLLVPPAGRRRTIKIIVNPDTRKLERAQFDRMLSDIMDDSYALFALSGYRRGFAGARHLRPPPLAKLEYIRSRVSEIETSVKLISARPVRRIQKEQAVSLLGRARQLTGIDISRSLGRRRIGQIKSAGHLPRALNGCYPIIVEQWKSVEDTDVREHREIKGTLLKWSTWLNLVARTLKSTAHDDDLANERAKWVSRCRRLSARIERLAGIQPFSAVAPSFAGLTPSHVFFRRPGYRQFFRHATDMRNGIGSLGGTFLDLPLARTFELYELWVYLRLVRAALQLRGIASIDGEKVFAQPDVGITLRGDQICVDIGAGAELCFQRTFLEYWKTDTGIGTFSRNVRPDISLQFDEGEKIVVLDAKYRVGASLNEAITSIHTYRDAVVAAKDDRFSRPVVAAYVVSPFKASIGEDWQSTAMPMRLFHPVYREKFKFGGISMAPGLSLAEVQDGLRRILDDAVS
ncbi:DUF2357 domain-containing protein [Bradyrhizobium yuanmingense]|uniref:DUF2357 domain-containing protein n=1 Tax=Bradyrhizobium yuanmingense TaxID=108015 RepID=UPI0004B1B7E7|nr:DUF2357 domain-containing protein [Bradyrhizobium yuanmingense]